VKSVFFLFILIALPCWSHAAGQGEATHPPRRLSDPQKKELAACLAEKPGRFSIMSIADNGEAYAYAQDWREVFESAGWKMEQQDSSTFRISGAKWSGMRVKVHDASQDQGQTALENDSPEQNFERCVAGKHDIPPGGRILAYRDRPTGSISIQVSVEPQR
jgi:hypothetical protein